MKHWLALLLGILTITSGYFWLFRANYLVQANQPILSKSNLMTNQLQSLLQKCLKDSKRYLSVEGLPEAPKVRTLIQQINQPFWQEFSPIENFFAFEIVPQTRQSAPEQTVRAAYTAALRQLPGDWWGMPGGTPSETTENLLQQPEIQSYLIELLDDTTPLQYIDGEANTLAEEHQWQVSDLAASFILTLSDQEYDPDAPVAERTIIKQELKKRAI